MKLGQFTVTDEFVADCPAVWSAIRRACVFKEEHRDEPSHTTRFLAECKFFEDIESGAPVPHYTWYLEREMCSGEKSGGDTSSGSPGPHSDDVWIERLYVGQGQHVATLRNREGPWPS